MQNTIESFATALEGLGLRMQPVVYWKGQVLKWRDQGHKVSSFTETFHLGDTFYYRAGPNYAGGSTCVLEDPGVRAHEYGHALTWSLVRHKVAAEDFGCSTYHPTPELWAMILEDMAPFFEGEETGDALEVGACLIEHALMRRWGWGVRCIHKIIQGQAFEGVTERKTLPWLAGCDKFYTRILSMVYGSVA